ncbi:alpha-L RNA-binding motif-containing protein [Aspergillus ellipticus CBS 707.79]|uniref:Small ribosomal subunit protein uS4m n=1 Tax=Aspergillus ellipticus CBS 707.79 TaxID=1448320 RepID=A0A319D8K6_9EURO|nr:alpha-L RNA-binding motif-containing protein [Aspergillus ellipticus CBS 707.79]
MRNRATTKLNKPKVRQSWSKWNLYNLQRFKLPFAVYRTHFQQKWDAKSAARAYHGEQVSEKQWTGMFSPRIRSVMPMDARKLAQDDGSLKSAGRGSGLFKTEEDALKEEQKQIPYSQMTFAPLERRLDVAIFRAMFASSARQARQFVIHGAVTVNGKPMRHPSYLLNPGDLFQVEPERVMYATGAPKDKVDRREIRLANKEAEEAKEKEAEAAEEAEGEAAEEAKENSVENPRKTLKLLLSQAKEIMSTDKKTLPAKRKQELRGFQKAVRRVLSRSESSTILTDSLESQFSQLTLLLRAREADKKNKDMEETQEKGEEAEKPKSKPESSADDAEATETGQQQLRDNLSEAFAMATQNKEVDMSELTRDEVQVLKRALVQMRDNPIDHSKPYATPWRPRDYMSAFATIPRYLEVNHNICAAVYLRHPVARPGYSEVPSPFSDSVGTMAFTWYLRRR